MHRRTVAVALVAFAAACSTGVEPLGLAPSDDNIVGTFGLNDAAGHLLPVFAGTTSTQEVDLIADTVTIASNNTWTETSYFRLTSFTDGTILSTTGVVSGTYAVSNKQINFTTTVGGNAQFPGSVTGNVLSIVFNNGRYLYGR